MTTPRGVAVPSVVSLIERKKRGEPLSGEEIRFLCRGLVEGSIPDYQIAAWLMAVYFRGMSAEETLALTFALVESGATMEWSHLKRPPVDKHSTGGVGDKTSLVLVPLMAAVGLPFVKMSGRGLGHTGGTLDKLEAIPGFSVSLSPEALREQIDEIGCALIGQSAELVPADGLLYALRDVTGTVDSLPLIASSVMSKKLAGGASAIVLDVKYGAGAFMPEQERARELARTMVRIGVDAGRKVAAVLSPMEEPLGCAIGNALEVREAIETLAGEGPEDLWDLTVTLGTQLLMLTGETTSVEEARSRLEETRNSGAALERFRELVQAQGGDVRSVDDTSLLPSAPLVTTLASRASGWVSGADARRIAEAALALGAGRRTKADEIDPAVGILLVKKVGAEVREGEPIAEIHARTAETRDEAARLLTDAFTFGATPPDGPSVRHEIIGAENA